MAFQKASARASTRVPGTNLLALPLLGIAVVAGIPRVLSASVLSPTSHIVIQTAQVAQLAPDTVDRLGPPPATDADPDERDRAVRLARAGRYDEALVVLRRRHREDPNDVPR